MSHQVLAVTMDGSSANRKLIKLHNTSSDVTYRIANPYTAEKRFLFFISDPPPLDKNHPKLLAQSNVVGMFFVPQHYCYVLFSIFNSITTEQWQVHLLGSTQTIL